MNIKPMVYETLTAPQRVMATLEALARGDDEEITRLKTTCPYKTYKQTDEAFAGTMEALDNLFVRFEADACAQALRFLFSQGEKPEELETLAAMERGWFSALETYGIRSEVAQKISAQYRTNEVAALFKVIESFPPVRADLVEIYKTECCQILERFRSLGGLVL